MDSGDLRDGLKLESWGVELMSLMDIQLISTPQLHYHQRVTKPIVEAKFRGNFEKSVLTGAEFEEDGLGKSQSDSVRAIMTETRSPTQTNQSTMRINEELKSSFVAESFFMKSQV